MTTSPASSASAALDDLVAANVARLRERITAVGRGAAHVRIVAVTKTFPATYVEAAAKAGLGDVGENYAKELSAKRAVTAAPVRWFYLGALQSNKITQLCRDADVLAAVARERELEKIGRATDAPPVYLEIDLTGDPARHGAPLAELETLLAAAQRHEVRVDGLMTVAPRDPVAARAAFAAVARAADSYGLTERSMGMSDDWEVALAYGSTEIRVGRALFGDRPVA